MQSGELAKPIYVLSIAEPATETRDFSEAAFQVRVKLGGNSMV